MFFRSKTKTPAPNESTETHVSESPNETGRLFAIGDIHGCASELSALITKLNPQIQDTVVFLGDYVDRGPNSKAVIDLILDLSKNTNVVALKGNHEAMLIDFLDAPEAPGAGMFVLNGGSSTLASYANTEGVWEFPEEHIHFFRNLKTHYQTATHFFVHAGVPISKLSDLNFNDPEVQAQMLWTRQPFLSSKFAWEKVIVHGHTPSTKIENLANRINLDTGCVFGHSLTALELPANVFHSVSRGEFGEMGPLPAEPDRISRRFSGQLPIRAGKPGGVERRYETLNYNQFGLLMRDVDPIKYEAVKPGEPIVGEIGTHPANPMAGGKGSAEVVKFVGSVVRTDLRGEYVLYAIRIDKISGGVWGPDWVERPAS